MNFFSIMQVTRVATTLFSHGHEWSSDSVSGKLDVNSTRAYQRKHHPFLYRWGHIGSTLAVTFIVALVVAVPVSLIALVLYFLGH
jgi:hypothetical protein